MNRLIIGILIFGMIINLNLMEELFVKDLCLVVYVNAAILILVGAIKLIILITKKESKKD